MLLKTLSWALASVVELVGELSHEPKGYGFNSQPGHMPGLQVQSPVWVYVRGNWSMFLTLMFLSHSLPPFPTV